MTSVRTVLSYAALAVLLAGCEKKAEPTSTTTPAAAATSGAAAQAAASAAEPAGSAVPPTELDYEKAARAQITSANASEKLGEIEKQLGE